jgi:tryptophanyl-tRNA synthetase
MNTFKLNLTSTAKKSGGDKYSGDLGDEKSTDIYIPQIISRESSTTPNSIINFTLSDVEIENSYTIMLTKQAKSKGGDKYEGEIKGEQFIAYLPQKITRKDRNPTSKLYISFEKIDKTEDKDEIIKKLQEENEELREEIEKLKEELENFMVDV